MKENEFCYLTEVEKDLTETISVIVTELLNQGIEVNLNRYKNDTNIFVMKKDHEKAEIVLKGLNH